MKAAPIVLFVYNRPKHAEITLNSLGDNIFAAESELFIYSDGPRYEGDVKKIFEIRQALKQVSGFKSVKIFEREKNIGLADSIVSGVTEVINQYGRAIVLEDDLLLSKYFLKFMNEALDLYEPDERVMHLSGWIPPVDTGGLPETFFYNKASCWGWATWGRAWKYFNADAKYLYDEIKKRGKMKEFNLDDSLEFDLQLKKNVSGKIKTWAVKWQASVFLRDGLCLQPKISLAQNIGHDDTGEHSLRTNVFDTKVAEREIKVEKNNLAESDQAVKVMTEFFRRTRTGWLKRLLNKFR